MAEDLLSMLPDGAQAAEDESRLAGNMQDAPVVDTAGSRDNPGGSTPTGGATDNTITEQAPESQPPAVGVTQDIPEPETDVGGGSGGLAGGATTIENPDQPRVVQTGVAQDDPALSPLTPLAAAEEANRPPTVTVLPENPAEPGDGDGDPGNDDDNFNEELRNDPLIQLAPGLVSEVGLENGLSQFATTQGTIEIGDPDGIGDIATVQIAGQLFTLSQLLTIDPLSPTFQIPLEAGDGDTEMEGVLTLQGFDPVTGVISFSFTLTSPVNNTNPVGNPNINQNSTFVPISATVTDLSGATATAAGGIRIVDATPLADNDGPFGVTEDAAPNAVSGNVTGNDSSGADAPLEFVSWDGATGDDLSAYGTLVQNPTTGAWSFTLNNSLAATQALTSADVKTAVYSYTIKDADGDLDTATLTVTVTGANDGATVETPNAEGADSTVYEAGLPTGSDVQPSDRDIASNTFTVSATDGIATVVIGGTSFTLAQLQALNGTQTVNTGEGVLTLNSYSGTATGGTVNYTYTLSATIDNDSKPGATGTEFNDSVEITVNGVGGTTASDQLVIAIIDDVPSAVNDGPFGVTEDAAPNAVSGNVTGNDSSGADAPLEFVSWDGATGDDLSAYGTLVQNPTTGAWSFTLNNSLAATQALTSADVKTAVYSYTIKDADGDLDTATLTVTVTGANDGATVETPNAEGADSTVYEAGLPTGSDVQPSDRDIASNTFTVSATDGIATVVIGGTSFTLAQLQALNGTQTVNTGEGVLTLNSYSGTATGGTVNYTYTLSATIDNDSKPGATGTEFNDSVEITVNGVGGTTASDQLVIAIIDDVPSAVNDGPFGVTEDAAPNAVSGNVTGNDSSGADAPLEFVSWDGATGDDLSAYGTLVQNPTTGAWSFTLNNSLAATQALTSADVKTAVYSYTIKDADGDLDTATLTVTVTGANDGATVETPNAEGADSTVYEAGLPTGSDVQPSDRDIASNTFTVSATDGIATVVIGGTSFTLAQLQALNGTQTVNTGEGVLTLNSYSGTATGGTVNYTYTLSATIDNDSKPGATGTEFNDSVEITVNGVGGTTASDQLVIAIIDDVPSAVNDGPFGVTEDAAPNAVSGNVTGNDSSGADAPLEFVSWDGATGDDLSAYGTLVQNPTTGAWSFTLNNSLAATQALTSADVKTAVYSYTIKDADGDLDTATLTVTVTGANDGATVETPNAEGADSTVYEAGLPTGSDVQPSDRDIASNTFTVSATDGIATVVIGGTSFTLAQLQALNGTQTVNTGEGVLTLNSYSGTATGGTVNYTYTLSATIDNDSKPGATGTEFNDSVEITVNGVGGTTASDQLVIAIIDDVPSAVNDGPFGVTEDAAPNAVSGNVTGNDSSGADAPLEFVSWDGATGDDLSAYGTLVQNPTTGAWSFTLNNSLAATQALTSADVKTAVYSYTIKDADGDLDTATLTVTVTGANDGATVETPNAEGADSTVYEAGLPTGSDVQPSDRDIASNTFTVSATDGIATVVIGGTSFTLAQLQALNGTQTVNTGEGVLTLNSYSGTATGGTVNYTYTLSATIDNDSKPGATGTEFNDSVEITVNGVGGTTASDQLVIAIIDDVPSAVNDGPFGVTEDAAPNAVSGNVTGNDSSGADAPLEFVSWDGATGDDLSAYGTLVQNPTTGAWSFTLNNSLAATQALTSADVKTAVYSYTIKDADGDLDTATLTVTVTGANDGATVETPNAEGADSTVYEAGLPTGSDVQPSDRDIASNTFTVSATDGIATVVIGGTSFTLAQLQALNGTQTVNTGEGVLTLNSYSGTATGGTVNYTYTLSATIDNDSKPGATGTEFNDSVEITVNGVGGTTASDQLVIAIIDDVPSAVNDGPFGVTEDAAPNAVSGNVTGNDSSGADAPLEFVSWDGATGDDLSAYGTLVQNPTTGAWSFTLNNSLAATQALTSADVKTAVYSYTIKDADGDLDTATLTVTVTGANDGATVETPNAEGADSTVYEAGLPTGSDVQPSDRDIASNTFTVSATDGIATVVIGGTSFTLAQLQALNGTQTVNTGEGVLTLNSYSGTATGGTVNYTYTLSATIDNDSKPGATGTEFNDSVEITVNGVGGTTASDQLVIAIIDDVPSAVNDGPFGVTEDAAPNAVSGNVTGNDSSGADAPLEFVSWDGATGDDLSAYGTLVQNPTTGAWSFTLNNSLAATQALTSADVKTAVYSYTIKDADGDLDTATLTVTINGVTDEKGIVVGQNVDDTNDQTVNHVINNTPSAPDGAIDGTPSADVLIGDVGGMTTTVVPGSNYNIIIIADTSGSMAWDASTGSQNITTISRINLVKASLSNLVNQLDDHNLTGGKVNFALVDFDTATNAVDLNGASPGSPSSVVNLTSSNSAGVLSAISSLSAGGGTNYEAAFLQAISEVNALQSLYSTAQGYTTITYFLTDGDPTYYLTSGGSLGGNGSDTTATILNESIATFSSLSAKSGVYAIGIGTSTNSSYLQFFDNTSNPVSTTITVGGSPVTGPAAPPDIVTTGDQLDSILQGGSTSVTVDPVGDDVINGGFGDDVILGDSIFSTSIDKGWAAYVSANPSLVTDKAKADDIYSNLTSANPTYAKEGSVGGNDIIDSGGGNDIIFGQGGNDLISAGAGNDLIVGGTGADTMTGGDGVDQFVFLKGQGSLIDIDTIADFAMGVDTILISGTAIIGVSVSSATTVGSTNNYTITVVYSDGTPTDIFKLALSNGGTLNDAGKNQTNGVVLVGGTTATIDGTIVGATVFLDVNHDGIVDAGEVVGVSDQRGHLEYVVDLSKLDVNDDGQFVVGEARAVLSGGTDIDTSLSYDINLYGPAGALVITPFTSLLQPLLEVGIDLDSASQLLVHRLGLMGVTDLLTLNPITASPETLAQNAAVMTAAVQFSELAARQLVTDEAHASWTVFSAISQVLSELPDGQVADFTSNSLLSAIADQLKLDHLASSDIIEFMAASQLALQRSLDTLPADADALAAISAVQHLVQGSYAQVLGSVANGDLAVQALDDLTHTLTAYGHGDLSLDQLDSFDQQLTLAGNDGQITESEFAQAASRLPDLAEDGAFAVAPVDALVADTPVPAVDIFIQDLAITDEQVVESEVASLDDLVEQYVGENALTDEAMAEYQQELALTEVSVTADMAADPAAIEPTADALAALDEVDALLSDDASDGIATVADVVDDFSYTV